MAKKQFFLIVDTETTIEDTVADFGAIVCDKQGAIFAECAVLVAGEYGTKKLFHDKNANDIWGYAGLKKRENNYKNMQLCFIYITVTCIIRFLYCITPF